ncbi:hypothetical protein G6F59_017467 [Rhizopus arrhizus]|nr:hypothetical protein G6F59_017467 [Rhizopus arrhizus]
MSFTPVLDLDYGVSKVIGNRAFHSDTRVLTMLSRALVQGLALAGMSACGKHFPGHGRRRAVRVVGRCRAAVRDAGARDLPQGRQASGRLLQALGAGPPAQAPGV